MLAHLPERILSKIVFDASDKCWSWSGATDPRGYAVTRWKDGDKWKNKNVTRVILGLTDRNIYACHSCDNPGCVNPAHLFPGTNRDNIKDAVRKGRHWNASKTHCDRGHAFSGSNLVIERVVGRSGNISIRRTCRECKNKLARANYKRRKHASVS